LQDSGKKRKALFKQKEEEDAYDISRYQPSIKLMLEEHFAGSLDQSTFPYVRDAPVSGSSSRISATAAPTSGSLRSARPQWTAQRAKRVVNEPKQRVMVFVAGGATYSEVRSVYKVSESSNKDVYLGTTALITPQQFASDLANLERGGSTHLATKFEAPSKSSKIPPASRPPGIPQQAFDARYNQKVAAAPLPSPPVQQQLPTPPPPQQRLSPASSGQDSRRPSSVASSGFSSGPPPPSSSSSLGSSSSHQTSAVSQNGSVGSKIKKRGFLKRLID
jgi:syntaxin-binding protein 1